MRSRSSFLLVSLLLAIPTAALADAPFTTPPQPDVPVGPPAIEHPPETTPPVTPPVVAPPFDFEVPTHPDLPDLGIDVPQGPPSPLPSAGAGIPDLVGVVDLPAGALDHVVDQAPPFGGEHGSAGLHGSVVPEPATGALLVLGLAGLAVRRRATA